MENTIFVFLCYIGDSWISYALSSFVQNVEDELNHCPCGEP